MLSLESIKDYMQDLNRKEILRILLIYSICFLFLVGFLLYRHFIAIADIEQKTKILNKARKDIQIILTEYDHIKSKKNEVDDMLTKDKNFYLVKYYQDTVKATSIMDEKSSALITQAGPTGYMEESLQINFTQITMQQLCEFLQTLQTTRRIFVKNLDILKSNIDKKINVNISIATLKPIIEKQPV